MNQAIKTKLIITVSAAALLGCSGPLDFDLRSGPFGTSRSVKDAMTTGTEQANNGIKNTPNGPVVVAKEGETISQIAARLGLDADKLARENGLEPGTLLVKDEVINLPKEDVMPADASLENGAAAPEINVTELADQALGELQANAGQSAGATVASVPTPTPSTAPSTTPAKPKADFEPIRHKVKRGETAFTISRLYNVTLRAIAEWNNLDANMTIREGQTLLIPLPSDEAPARKPSGTGVVSAPGAGTLAPEPPKIAAPLPVDEDPALNQPAPQRPAPAPAPNDPPKAASSGKMIRPVNGEIIIGFREQGNEGVDFKAPVNAPVVAAKAGQVVAITQDQKKVNIVVIRHQDNLLTVYANLSQLTVKRGDNVTQGQKIGQVDSKNNNQLHFEVRDGFDALNPMDFL